MYCGKYYVINIMPDCEHPGAKMEIYVPDGREAEEYINWYLKGILRDNICHSIDWDFV